MKGQSSQTERNLSVMGKKKSTDPLDNRLEEERGQDIKILGQAIFSLLYPDFAGGKNGIEKGLESREMTYVIHHCSAWVLEHCQN